MTKIVCPVDCGNAPKKQFVKVFNIAFAKADIPTITAMLADDAEWEMIGQGTVSGKTKIQRSLEQMDYGPAKELVIKNIISHGDVCAANGVMKYGASVVAFCDVYKFSSHAKDAKIKRITSYAIDLQ